MIRIQTVQDMGRFLRTVERCRGEVTLHLRGGVVCNLKRDPVAMELLRAVPSAGELHVSLSDRDDFPVFLQYLMEAGRENHPNPM